MRDHPRLAVQATAALVIGWILGGVVLLVGLAVLLIAVALLLVAVGLLIFSVGLAVSSLAVVPLTGGHVYYRLTSMRA